MLKGRQRPTTICLNSSKYCACWQFWQFSLQQGVAESYEHEASANGDVMSRMCFASEQRTGQTYF